MSSCRGEQSWDQSKDSPVAGLAAVQGRVASWLLDWPLTAFLSLVCPFMLATWIPHYVTWPWYCDHDHFAELAQLWDSGTARPYRDVFSFQFPGEIYVFWALGRVFGWGNSIAFYAFDAILVIGFGVILSLWSRRLFGRIAPGLIGYSLFLYYYLVLLPRPRLPCIITSASITASPPSGTGTPLSSRFWACCCQTSLPAAGGGLPRVLQAALPHHRS